MCWTTFEKEKLQKKTAKQDIKVIKILLEVADRSFVSPYRVTKYHINGIMCSEIGQPIKSWEYDMWAIYEGLHSYSPNGIRFGINIESLTINIMSIKDAERLDYWHHFSNAVIFEGVIPSGSEYYENERGEIVSNALKVVSVIAEIDRDLVYSDDKIQALNEKIHNLLGACASEFPYRKVINKNKLLTL